MVLMCLFILHTVIRVSTEVQSVKLLFKPFASGLPDRRGASSRVSLQNRATGTLSPYPLLHQTSNSCLCPFFVKSNHSASGSLQVHSVLLCRELPSGREDLLHAPCAVCWANVSSGRGPGAVKPYIALATWESKKDFCGKSLQL